MKNHSFLDIPNEIEQNINFIVEIDKLKSIYRKALVMSDNDRFENTAEHTWHTCIVMLTLNKYFTIEYDINHTLKLLLIHDLVEIYAGDTFAFDEKSVREQESKELHSIEILKNILPINDEFDIYSLWIEFNSMKTNESAVANSIDKITSFILNYKNNGGTWKNITVSLSNVLKRNSNLKNIAPQLWELVEKEAILAQSKGLLS